MRTRRPKGCIYQRPDSSVWWIKYSLNGKSFRESTHSENRRKAVKLLERRLGEIGTGAFVGPEVDKVTVQELAEDYLRDYRINGKRSIRHAEFRWTKHLRPFFGIYRAMQVTSESVARYIESRQQEGAANATINRELAALKRMFRLGLQSTPPKVLRLPKIPRLREDNVRTGFLEDGQYRKLVEYCPELWFRSMVEVGRTYGWRVSEVKGMRVSQLDLLHRTIRLEPGTTKNREGREVSMTDAVYALLRECAHGKTPDAFVFTRPNGKPILSFRKLWAKACAFAGCPELLFHDLRRTAARNLRRAGVAEGLIMRIGGWKTRSVFERYSIITQADIKDAITKLQASEKAQKEQQEEQREDNFGHVFGHGDAKRNGSVVN
jgi:integrase